MKTKRQARMRVALIALLVTVIFPLATVRRAHAYGEGAVVAGAIMVWVTYLTAKTLICAPVAAFKASEPQESFGTAFKSCWNWRTEQSTAEPPTQADQAAENTPAENGTIEPAHPDEGQAE